ncbi:MAG: fasciclin domain-containing protein, partial [Anaerolineae bacterium]
MIFHIAYSGQITFDTAQDHIVNVAAADSRFDTLAAAVTYTGLADTLSAGDWTVFAPTDTAFAKLDLN